MPQVRRERNGDWAANWIEVLGVHLPFPLG